MEAWELNESMGRNEGKEREEREWWILKPGMSDRGQGIRLFSTLEELQSIFEEWEAERPDSDDEEEDEESTNPRNDKAKVEEEEGKDYIVTSHLRHFTTQPYIHPPLLLPSLGNRKFHIRTYVLALGSLKIYVYKPMLALFASTPYTAPWSASSDLSPHLTNTCLQSGSHDGSVLSFFSSALPIDGERKEEIFKQICDTTGEVFEAAAKGMMVHFQTLPNAFEVFGLDFLVDGGEEGRVWLLEVNAFPDFRQTGGDLKDIVRGLWREVVRVGVGGFFGGEREMSEAKEEGNLLLVRNVKLGRK